MANESAAKLIDKILSSNQKFKRAIIVLLIIGAVTCYGFYSGEISKIFGAIFHSSPAAQVQNE